MDRLVSSLTCIWSRLICVTTKEWASSLLFQVHVHQCIIFWIHRSFPIALCTDLFQSYISLPLSLFFKLPPAEFLNETGLSPELKRKLLLQIKCTVCTYTKTEKKICLKNVYQDIRKKDLNLCWKTALIYWTAQKMLYRFI